MEATLKALADLLLEAVPTVVFFLFLIWFLNRVYFRPVAAILAERRQATEGVRDLAEKANQAADQKQSEFERAIQLARGEIYKEHEELRRQWSEEQAASIAEARAEALKKIEAAKAQIFTEAEKTQGELDQTVEGLSGQIVESLVGRRAA